MPNTANVLVSQSDGLTEQSGMSLHATFDSIVHDEANLRARIAELIAKVGERENWKLQRSVAIARRIEHTAIDHLEPVHEYFRNRSEGRAISETPEILADFFADSLNSDGGRESERATPHARSIADLYSRLLALESRVSEVPGQSFRIQGIRIMRVIALMSKARTAEIVQTRSSGMQVIYRHG